MNRYDLQVISILRQKEAKVLLDNEYYSGAYYLIGYTVECALKACIAKQIKRFDFPDKKLINDSYVHKLPQLLDLSGLKSKLHSDFVTDRDLELNWTIVKDWSEESRYDTALTKQEAIDLYTSVTQRKSGILSWLKKRW